jgi:hypothetical protein
MAYVYLVKNISTGYKYIGSKSGKSCDPRLFWITYFTSSNMVKILRKLYGDNDFIYKIVKIFDDDYSALEYERNLIKLSFSKNDYINLHPNFIGELSKEEFIYNKSVQTKLASEQGKLCFINKTGIFKFNEEEKIEICSKGGKKAAIINKKLNRAIFDPLIREKQHETLRSKQLSAYYNPNLRQEISSLGGKNGSLSKKYRDRNNISDEEFINKQSERGKKGGSENIGFKWYNDGDSSYKYTKEMQEELIFEDFLKQNIKYFSGRIVKSNKGSKCYNDDVRCFVYTIEDQDKLPFDEFLKQNPQYKIGRIVKKNIKNSNFIWYNDGINTFKYTKEMQENITFDEFLKQNQQYNKGCLFNKK